MQKYSTFAPTGFDRQGAFLSGQGEWLVAPCKRNRDSNSFDSSNWDQQLEMLGGESKRAQIHRFGHWACGWFEIVLINPRSKLVKIGNQIESQLENYPILDENDWSQREFEAYCTAFKDDYKRCFASAIETFMEENEIVFDEFNEIEGLEHIPIEKFQEFFESLIPSGEYYIEEYPQFDYAIKKLTVENVKQFLQPIIESVNQMEMTYQ